VLAVRYDAAARRRFGWPYTGGAVRVLYRAAGQAIAIETGVEIEALETANGR